MDVPDFNTSNKLPNPLNGANSKLSNAANDGIVGKLGRLAMLRLLVTLVIRVTNVLISNVIYPVVMNLTLFNSSSSGINRF